MNDSVRSDSDAPTRTPPADHVVPILRERLYGSLACLSTLLVLLQHDGDAESSAWAALLDVGVAAISLWAASLLSDYVAHMTIHGARAHAAEALRMVRASSQILQAALAPALLLVASGVGLLELSVALRIGIGVSVLSLGLFALLAARRTRLGWWKRLAIVASLVGLGAVVVGVKIVAHG